MVSRGIWHRVGARTRRALALSWSALFVLSLLLQYASFAAAPAALAAHNEGLFELDGNALDQATAGADWQNGAEGSLDQFFAGANVEASANDNTYFTTGGSKDENDIPSWAITPNAVPDKDELTDAYAAVYQKNGETWVYFGADRFDNDGDAQIGFWFFQNKVGIANGDFTGTHKNGDVLILSEYTNGGVVDLVCAYEWDSAGGGSNIAQPGDCDPATNGSHLNLVAAGAACDIADGTFDICAVTNAVVSAAPWTFTNKDGAHDFAPGQFFEGGINLSDMFGDNPPCFGTFLAETRSSQETDAQLKDFALGSLSTCVPPTIATAASSSLLHFGDSVTDTATLSGSNGPASGSVKFFVCGPSGSAPDCSTGGSQVGGAVAVSTTSNGGTATSAAYTPGAAGFYCFRAEYTPDDASQYLAGSHTNQTTECFELVKNVTTITTAATQTVNVGQSISDSATLAGATSDAGGHITFRAYGPADTDCTGTPAFTSASFPVSGNGTYGPASFTPATAGVYRWIASYSGDAKNEPSIGQCNDAGENDTVNKVTPSIATDASDNITIGGSIHDTATVTGGSSPTGTVTFKLYGPNDANCTGSVIFTSADRPLSGGTATSASFTPTLVGTYRWIATYNGDANNNAVSGACNAANENVEVIPAHPSIATELVSGAESGTTISIALGAAVHDTSTLTGATATAGGTVHYQVFSDATCDTKFADAGTIPVVNGVPGNSISVTFNQSGNYYWQADYSGDAANDPASSDCSLEVVSVGLNEPTISTNASDSVVVGGDIHDTATLAGGFNPTGTITFRLYGPNDATCTGAVIFSSTVNVNGNGDYDSASFKTSVAGTYRWIATYSGDANNAAAAGACNDADENVVVTTPNLHAVKLVATGNGPFGPTSQAQPGDVVNYQITVTNSGDADAINVPVSDDIAPILTHATYNDDCSDSCVLDGTTLKWTIASIAKNGGSEVLTFSVTLDADFPTGVTHLPNVVVVTGPGSNCAAGSEDADCDTDTTVSASTLTIDKTLADTGATDPDLGVPLAEVGDTLHYTLAYEGHGPITNAVITDVLPLGIEYVDGSAAGDANFTFDSYDPATRTLKWTAATLPDPATGSVTYDALATEAAAEQPQPLVNTATISSDQTPPDSDTASVAVLAPPQELTPPPTDTFTPQTATSNPGFSLMLLLLGIAGLTLGIGFITPAPASVRRRDGRR
ncbi:MAG TPA: hypothetical protein VFJ71_02025 [Candidatus Limnocylindrales bacterium]|nr:hypothetical protein [Candidatus Limnocylindrales bacterium]